MPLIFFKSSFLFNNPTPILNKPVHKYGLLLAIVLPKIYHQCLVIVKYKTSATFNLVKLSDKPFLEIINP